MNTKKKIATLLVGTCLLTMAATNAFAQSEVSTGSALSVQGSAQIVEGSVNVIAGAGNFTITALQQAGDFMLITLQSVADASRVVVRVPVKMAGGASLAVGHVLTTTTTASGYLLEQGGQVIAFIPNEVGKSLIHHSESQ